MIAIIEYYIIDQYILNDFFHFIQSLLKLRFKEILHSFIKAYERLLHIFSCENQSIFVTFLNRTVCEIFKFLISDRLLHMLNIKQYFCVNQTVSCSGFI